MTEPSALDDLVRYVRTHCDEAMMKGAPGPDLLLLRTSQYEKVRAEAKLRGGFTDDCYCGCGQDSILGLPVIVVNDDLPLTVLLCPEDIL